MPNLDTVRRVVLKPRASASTSPPIITFASSATGSGSATITATGVDFGSAYATRRIYAFLLSGFVGATVNTGTSFVGGTTNPDLSGQAINSGSGVSMWWMSALQPSGTTGQTVTFDLSSNPFSSGYMGFFSVDNSLLSSATPTIATNTASAATTVNTTVATSANGCIITALCTAAGTTSQNISASTETFTTDVTGISNAAGFGHANGVAANASSSCTWSWTTNSDAGIALFAIR